LLLRRLSAVIILATPLLTGCSLFEAPTQVRGNPVDPDQLSQLVVGTSTKADVQTVLGSPTTQATFDPNTWVYISEVTRPQIARTQGVEKQNVTVLTFDQSGVLRDVKRLNQNDSLPVQFATRTTPSPGTEATFMQMLLGNVGKFSPTAGAGQSNGFSVGGQ
jgi:outer membrane protein assembly factor BamE (lipoprotein component of BamABCDE complex)